MPPTSPDVSWVEILPSAKGFLPELNKQLNGALGPADTRAGNEFGGGFQKAALNGVEAASTQLVAAQRKVEDAAGAGPRGRAVRRLGIRQGHLQVPRQATVCPERLSQEHFAKDLAAALV